MAFAITEEAVPFMRDMEKKIPIALEGLQKANEDVIKCYEDVKETVGPHTREIETIVNDLNRAIQQSSEKINEIPDQLENLAKHCEAILRNRPKSF